MGRRHQRNQNQSSIYSYAEREKDRKDGQYGTLRARLSADSFKEFDCCCLTLQPCREPLVSPDGYIYDKQAIIEYYLNQKKDMKRKLQAYYKEIEEEELDKERDAQRRLDMQIEKFSAVEATPAHIGKFDSIEKQTLENEKYGEKVHNEKYTATDLFNNPSLAASSSSIFTSDQRKRKEHGAFWVPGQQDAKKHRMEKPTQEVLCPMSGKPLKIKDLIPVKFTLLPENEVRTVENLSSKKQRFMCPVTRDALTNSVASAVLRPTGDVVTMDCINRIVRKEWTHPLTGEPITEADIIPLQRGGTGFAAVHGDKLKATTIRPNICLQ